MALPSVTTPPTQQGGGGGNPGVWTGRSMILDTSAIIAILLREPLVDALLEALNRAPSVAVGAPTLVETSIVLGARIGFPQQGLALTRWLHTQEVTVVNFNEQHWAEAARAYDRFGKGRHSAALNFGDCLSYAVSSLTRRPLLCVGEDFKKTDLPLVDY
jgi:ribonuclease VapC